MFWFVLGPKILDKRLAADTKAVGFNFKAFIDQGLGLQLEEVLVGGQKLRTLL